MKKYLGLLVAGFLAATIVLILSAGIGYWLRSNDEVHLSGQRLYQGACARCHGDRGQGLPQWNAPALAGADAAYIELQLTRYRSGRLGNTPGDFDGKRMMEAAKALRSPEQVKKVADYVSSLPQ